VVAVDGCVGYLAGGEHVDEFEDGLAHARVSLLRSNMP
jgi:hypothetical protein